MVDRDGTQPPDAAATLTRQIAEAEATLRAMLDPGTGDDLTAALEGIEITDAAGNRASAAALLEAAELDIKVASEIRAYVEAQPRKEKS